MLPQDVSISIEEQNPLFSDSGSFSYPIELSISQNRELFKSIDSPQGRIRPQDLDGLPFELWFDGVMLLYGSTETDEDLNIDEDKCSINLVSGNGDFQSKIEGMQCTDVPLLDKLRIGYGYPSALLEYRTYIPQEGDNKLEVFLDEANTIKLEKVNVSEPYPLMPYCNARICAKRTDEYDKSKESPYIVLEAERPNSGLCFYVGYFLKSLFHHLGYVISESHFRDVEDMKRLAFFSTKCVCDKGEVENIDMSDLTIQNGKAYASYSDGYTDIKIETRDLPGVSDNWKINIRKETLYASSKNFPATDVSSVVESLFNAFGLKVVCNEKEGTVSLYYMRDILRDNEVVEAEMQVRSRTVQYSKIRGVRLTYGGDDEDTAFSYKDFTKDNSKPFTNYKEIINNVQANDKTCYVSQLTGNKYRIKIDKDAEESGEEKNLNPSLFEVAQFNDYVVGENTEDAEELKISFTPLIENDVLAKSLMQDEAHTQQTLAVYIDGVELKKEEVETQIVKNIKLIVPAQNGTAYANFDIKVSQHRRINYDRSNGNDDPLQSHDSGFTLGVMRGPGSTSGYEVFFPNYDGNNNSAWATVAADYAFTADTMDAYGNRYDYNGESDEDITEEDDNGIINQENSISLKTHIQTAQDVGLEGVNWGINGTAAKRGLADRFMSEYMHFLLNRKTVSMDVDTTLSQLTSLSWFKQLRINDTVGRLKSRSYTLTNSGVSDMNIELYTTN